MIFFRKFKMIEKAKQNEGKQKKDKTEKEQ